METVDGECRLAASRDKQPHILIVDDEDCVRTALLQWFSLRGFTVDEARDGIEAVEKCAQNHYDAITMDLEMPRMTGAEAIAVIQSRRPHLPILVLTGYAKSFPAEALAGVAAVLTKPVPLRLVEEALRKALDWPNA